MEEYGARNDLLLLLGYRNYKAYLRSDLWKAIREKQLSKSAECFTLCGKLANQVHHGSYDEATLLGESNKDLFSVCQGCHLKAEVTKGGHKRSPTGATNELKRMRLLHSIFKSKASTTVIY